MPDEALLALRQATAPLHQQLDQHRVLKPLMSASLSPAQYAVALASLLRPQQVLEEALQQALTQYYPEYRYALRYPWLQQDLQELGQPCPEASDLNFSIHGETQGIGVLGLLYVLEGSRLGAQVMLKNLRRCALPCAFFASALNSETEGWPGFLQLLRHTPQQDFSAAVETAVDAFHLLLKRM